MTLEHFPLDFVDLTLAFLFLAFLPDPTGTVTLPAAVSPYHDGQEQAIQTEPLNCWAMFSLSLWS